MKQKQMNAGRRRPRSPGRFAKKCMAVAWLCMAVVRPGLCAEIEVQPDDVVVGAWEVQENGENISQAQVAEPGDGQVPQAQMQRAVDSAQPSQKQQTVDSAQPSQMQRAVDSAQPSQKQQAVSSSRGPNMAGAEQTGGAAKQAEANSKQANPKQANPKQANPKQANFKQANSKQANFNQTNFNQSNFNQKDHHQTDSDQQITMQTDLDQTDSNPEKIDQTGDRAADPELQTVQNRQMTRAYRVWMAGMCGIYGLAILLWLLLFCQKGGKERMKKVWNKLKGSFLCLLLAASVAIPKETVAMAESFAEQGRERLLFETDPRMDPEQELNEVLANTEWEDIGVWLKSMDETDREALLSRDTILMQETTVTEWQVSGEGELYPNGVSRKMRFYEYALLMADQPVRGTFANKTGYYQYQFIRQDQVCTFTVKLSGIDTSLSTSQQQTVTIAVSREGDNFVNFAQSATKAKLERAFGNTDGTFYNLYLPFSFTKPKGYTGSVKYANKKADSRGDLYFYDAGAYATKRRTYQDSNSDLDVVESVIACTNIGANTSVGSSTTVGKAMIYQIELSPINYTTDFNGNGSTGGNVASQSNVYGKTYALPANGFSRQYTVNFNGNGGGSAQASAVSSYIFTGWGYGQKNAVTHQPGQTYSNYTTTNNARGTFYAIWQPASVKLPTAFRAGYTFMGWNTGAQAEKGNIAGDTYTPTADTTLYATWKANEYAIRYYNGLTDKPVGMQNMIYGDTANLIRAKELGIDRPGYVFAGWKGNAASYQDGQSVSNLTDVSGGVIELIALWEAAEDTPYTVEHYKEQHAGERDYCLEKAEKLQGRTDAGVSPLPLSFDGYEIPDRQSVMIDADGSTVIKYYYHLKAEADNNGNTVIYQYHNGAESLNEGANENDGDINHLKMGDTRYVTDNRGNRYEIYVNPDGTLTLRSMTVEDAKKQQVKIDGMLTINNTKYKITEIAPYAFKNNKKIRTVTIADGITRIGKSAFEGCSSLRKVKLGVGVSVIGPSAFRGCTALESVKTTKTLCEIGSKAFYNCKKLKSYTIGKYVKSIGAKAFYNCRSLKKIVVSESVETIGKQAFAGCRKLSGVNIKSRKLIKIGKAAFRDCGQSLKFKIPSQKRNAYIKLLKGKA
ncbi:MAG: leucine-rich repeat protein [Lachnospiraceae bacterium]|nr:leucine-rich repeat protein [Lachnospiraceae bacterium]